MLSIIICSRHKKLDKGFVDNIAATVGIDYELVAIDNSDNFYSIFSAYNQGVVRSKFPYLCFVHEDVLFHSKGWGQKVIAHLQDKETGIVGVVGSSFMPRVPAAWATLPASSYNLIQSFANAKKPTTYELEPKNFTQSKRSAVILDGLFFCMRKDIFFEIKFDENLKGFHGYDYDISLQSLVAGYQNYVIYDIKLEHSSGGHTDMVFFRNLIAIFRKWEIHLPLFTDSFPEEVRKKLSEIEKKKLRQLTKKMVRKGFGVRELKKEITYYAEKIDDKKGARLLSFRIFLIRLFNCPKSFLTKNRIQQ
jgi:GT2 family glycosyltransferase